MIGEIEKSNIKSSSPSSTPNTPINYFTLASEVITNLRGTVSQRQLSERMGFSFNQVGKWESGATHIKWSSFLKLAHALEIPIEKNLTYYLANFNDFDFNGSDFLEFLYEKFSLDDCDRNLKKDMKKWIKNPSSLYLSDFLRILDSRPSMLFGWIAAFTEHEKLPSIQTQLKPFLTQLEIVSNDVFAIYVTAGLSVTPYTSLEKHDEKVLAIHSACSVEQVRETLKNLTNAGVVYFNGKKYIPRVYEFSFSSLRTDCLRRFNKYTVQLAAERLPVKMGTVDPSKVKNECRGSVRVAALSPEASEKIGLLMSKFHNEMGEIFKNDKGPKEHVQVITMQTFASNMGDPRNDT